MGIEAGIARAQVNAEARHYLNHPGHGRASLGDLCDDATALLQQGSDDPAIYAYELRDFCRRAAGRIIDMEKWCHAVIEAEADDIPSEGAQMLEGRR